MAGAAVTRVGSASNRADVNLAILHIAKVDIVGQEEGSRLYPRVREILCVLDARAREAIHMHAGGGNHCEGNRRGSARHRDRLPGVRRRKLDSSAGGSR